MNALGNGTVLCADSLLNISYIIPYIRYYNEDIYDAPWQLKQRTISDHEIIFITEGTARFTIDKQIYDLKANDLLIIYPEILHEAHSTSRHLSFYCAHFDFFVSLNTNTVAMENINMIDTIPQGTVRLEKAELDFPQKFNCAEKSEMNFILRKIIRETRNRTPGFGIMMKACILELFLVLSREIKTIPDSYCISEEPGRKISSKTQREIPGEIIAALEYIRNNYSSKLTLPATAAHVHLQSSYFCTLFKKHMGISYSEYIKLIRLNKARQLLHNSNDKIEQIAHDTGFCDIHHFYKVFRKYEGVTPVHYRQMKNIGTLG